MSYGQHMNDLTDICTMVWACSNLVDKRNLLKRAANTFKYKEKKQRFLDAISRADHKTCDKIASNLILNKDNRVVDLLPR